MKSKCFPLAVAAVMALASFAEAQEDGLFKIFPVYGDAKSPDNHYTSSGWMGDFGDIKFNDKYLEKPHSGTTSIQVIYMNKASQGARWAGIYWQNPPNNWGTRPGGYDLTGSKKLTFWARGEKGGESVSFQFGLLGKDKTFFDTAQGKVDVKLTDAWQQYTIALEGKDLTRIKTGFACVVAATGEPIVFYLDDIVYE